MCNSTDPTTSAMPAQQPDADAHLRETRMGSERVFSGYFLQVQRDTVRLPNGQQASREYIVHPGAVVVIAVAEPGDTVQLAPHGPAVAVQTRSVLMERQYRHPVGQVIREFPAGKRDAGEGGQACAERELREETGFAARDWVRAGQLMPTVAYADEVIEIWFARGLSQQGRRLDEGEFLDVELVSVDELTQWCRQGQLPDAKSVTCLWWLEQWAAGLVPLCWQPSGAKA